MLIFIDPGKLVGLVHFGFKLFGDELQILIGLFQSLRLLCWLPCQDLHCPFLLLLRWLCLDASECLHYFVSILFLFRIHHKPKLQIGSINYKRRKGIFLLKFCKFGKIAAGWHFPFQCVNKCWIEVRTECLDRLLRISFDNFIITSNAKGGQERRQKRIPTPHHQPIQRLQIASRSTSCLISQK